MYSRREWFVGISGNKDGIENLADGEFLTPWELNSVEKELQKRVQKAYPGRRMITGRCAHLTQLNYNHLQTYYYGRRPSTPIIPSFRNVQSQETDFLRGYMTFLGAGS